MIVEAEFSPGMALDECQEIARLIESAGFDRLGVSDVVLWPDTFIVQALCAKVTKRLEIGSMVGNPYLRHPAVTAAAVAGIQEISEGRAFIGLGVGAGLDVVGVNYPRPVATLREAIEIVRALLDGETVNQSGSVFHVEGAKLRMPPAKKVPIAIGTRSERVASLAGELADRALVGARYLSPTFADRYRSWVTDGEALAGRPLGEVEVAPRLTLCCSRDKEAAYATMRRDAAEFLVTLRPDDLTIEPERIDEIASVLSKAKGWYFDPDAYHPRELDDLIDDALVEAFSLCGNGDALVGQFRRVEEMGFRSVSLKLAPVRRSGWSMFDGLVETVTTVAEVMPAIKALGAA